MKRPNKIVGWIGLSLLVLMVSMALRVPADAQLNGTYIALSASVNSTTVPVSVLAPGGYAAWQVTTKTGAAVTIDCFFYTGTIPGSPPSNFAFFVNPGAAIYDNQVQTYKLLPQAGIGCVLDTGVTAVATASIGRTG